ncbi:Beta-glucanase [Anaerolineae bacterium]|nr:Beta-glucanase [Anaerolineae bacterium]
MKIPVKTFRLKSRLLILTILLSWLLLAQIAPSVGQSDRLLVVDDFEVDQLPTGSAAGLGIGFVTWSDGSPVSVTTEKVEVGTALALPDQSGANTVLRLETTIKAGGWGGFTHAFTNEALDQWVAQDWSSYEGLSMWVYGNNTGGTLFIDLLENRPNGSKVDDAERWSYPIPDTFSGWQLIKAPFLEFKRKDIGNGAPNDGLTLDAVYGYALGAVGSIEMGKQVNYVDQVTLYGLVTEEMRPVELRFVSTTRPVVKGGIATFRVVLNKAAKKTVTVDYFAAEGSAVEGRDFILPRGTLTFEPGTLEQQFRVQVLDDGKATGVRKAVLVLANAQGAQIGAVRRAVMLIRDPHDADPNLITDFDEIPPFTVTTGAAFTTATIAPENPLAQPDQSGSESILKIDYDSSKTPAYIGTRFVEARNWSEKSGVSLWYYGTNTGQPVSVELLTNKVVEETTPDAWELVWSDEFNDPAGTSPNPAVWRAELGDGLLNENPGWGNAELEFYTGAPENVSTDGQGSLVITARKIDPAASEKVCWYGPCEYTSSRLITWDRLEFTYGRVEARIKVPYGNGIWPAFWMLGTNIGQVGWPTSGEIDIMENIGREPATVHGAIHGPGYSGARGLGGKIDLESGRYADDYHVYAIEWKQDEIKWFVDGENFLTLTPKDIPSGAEWVYNHPFFLIMNVAVGGNWPGNPDESSTYPQMMAIDYVRVYQNPTRYDQVMATFTDDFTGWKLIELPFSAFNAPDKGLDLEAIWGYGFYLPAQGQGTVYMDKLRFLVP